MLTWMHYSIWKFASFITDVRRYSLFQNFYVSGDLNHTFSVELDS